MVLPFIVAEEEYGYIESQDITDLMIDEMTKKKDPGSDLRAIIYSRYKINF